jgi:hypothetical protein
VRSCLIHTCHAASVPCHDHAVLKATSQDNGTAAWAWHGVCELSWTVQRRHGTTCPHSAYFGYHAEFHGGCYQKHTNPVNCRTSISDISGYHADFHEGHGAVGEWQGHGMCELAFIVGIRSVWYFNSNRIIRHEGPCSGLGGSQSSHRGDFGSKPVKSTSDLQCIIPWFYPVQFSIFIYLSPMVFNFSN